MSSGTHQGSAKVLSDSTMLALRQPRAAGVFLVLCVTLGFVGGGSPLGIASDLALSALEVFLLLDAAMIYLAWPLVLRRDRAAPAQP